MGKPKSPSDVSVTPGTCPGSRFKAWLRDRRTVAARLRCLRGLQRWIEGKEGVQTQRGGLGGGGSRPVPTREESSGKQRVRNSHGWF